MFSAIKRLAGKSDGVGNASARPAHQSMPTNLQRKFAKGVQYNSEYARFVYVRPGVRHVGHVVIHTSHIIFSEDNNKGRQECRKDMFIL